MLKHRKIKTRNHKNDYKTKRQTELNWNEVIKLNKLIKLIPEIKFKHKMTNKGESRKNKNVCVSNKKYNKQLERFVVWLKPSKIVLHCAMQVAPNLF